MELFYQYERDIAFLDACNFIRSITEGYISVEEITRRAIRLPAPSFFLSVQGCVRIIKNIRSGYISTALSRPKKALYKEIRKRYLEISAANPTYSAIQIARIIEEQEAPRFYISEHRARNLYYDLHRKRNNKPACSSPLWGEAGREVKS